MLTSRHSNGPASQRHRRDGLDRKGIGVNSSLSELSSARTLLPSLDRSCGYGSHGRYFIAFGRPPSPFCPRGPPPSSLFVVPPIGRAASCERPCQPDQTSPVHRPSPPFIASATGSDSTRGRGHGRAVEQLRVAWDRVGIADNEFDAN
ncbi:hypothetical protein PRIPAC_71286 [Pristionchus pacificus]|uniref:Uncharacterized protein n=1 Tax=Pristionchus pacificus TaxID=54126 RepID=A0A2A6C1J1_PRIPA|nr:hypothetical protein PRIPAC_71286 [Pristionchus pacificus]|eukprot:PDM71893.1 hypothetical protein PRIPAC_38300 [Pristionchus pacificus]